MALEDFGVVLKMLEELNFQGLTNVSQEMICEKCRKILRNACQVSCQCLFCFDCIEEMKGQGLRNCIGKTEDCGKSVLSNYIINFKINRKISQLVTKFPRPKCDKQYPLIEMVDHLNHCSKDDIKCIFHEYGCNQDDIEKGEMQQHLLTKQECHSKIILDMFGVLQNEMNENRKWMAKKDSEMEMMKEELKRREEEVNSLKTEIESIKNASKISNPTPMAFIDLTKDIADTQRNKDFSTGKNSLDQSSANQVTNLFGNSENSTSGSLNISTNPISYFSQNLDQSSTNQVTNLFGNSQNSTSGSLNISTNFVTTNSENIFKFGDATSSMSNFDQGRSHTNNFKTMSTTKFRFLRPRK